MKRTNCLSVLLALMLCLMATGASAESASASFGVAGEYEAKMDAAQIIAKYAGASDAEKLAGYQAEICELMSSSDAAGYALVPFADHGQRICVLDDPAAGADHESYARAFQDLCDLSEFSGEVRCYTVFGVLQCENVAGPHRWNIVQIDGINYLADVANSDEGCIGQNGELFLTADAEGEWSDKYTFPINGVQISYEYDADVRELLGKTVLELGGHQHAWTRGSCIAPSTCSVCGATSGKALGHRWQGAGCTTASACSVCGMTSGIPAGHTYGAPVFTWSSGGQATATFTCTRCSAPTEGHTVTRNADVVQTASMPGTCQSEGSVTYKAKVEWNGAVYTNVKTIKGAKGAHSLRKTAASAATCAENGHIAYYTCAVCGGLFADRNGVQAISPADVIVSAAGHAAGEPLIMNETPATCTANGSYDTVVSCKACGREISRKTTVIGAIGHAEGEPAIENRTEAGCTTNGSCETVVRCLACGTEVRRETTVLPATGHMADAAVITNEVPATCLADGGYDLVAYCQNCAQEVSRTHTVVGRLGHGYQPVVTAPTCTAAGYTTYTCAACGDSYEGDRVATVGHVEKEAVIEKETAATCSKDGSVEKVVYCAACGIRIRSETVVIQATGNHVYSYEQERVAATCTAAGRVVMACGCGATQQTVLPATGHSAGRAVITNEVPAGCTTPGSYDTVVKCTVCGGEISRQTTTIGATGHTDQNGDGICDGCQTAL